MNQLPPHKRALSSGIPFLGMALVGCLPSFLKCAYYRMRGATIGAGVHLGIFSYIASPHITIENGARMAPFSFAKTHSFTLRARSRIAAFVAIDTRTFELGEDASIGEQVTIGGMQTPRSALTIGARTKVLPFCFLNPTEAITIEEDVCIGGGSYIFTHGTWQPMIDGFPGGFGAVHIKRGAWLAWRGFVMHGVTIGEEATIGAGAVVTRDIPARSLAVGVPAKVIKTAEEYIRPPNTTQQHEMMLKWLSEYAELYSMKSENIEDGLLISTQGLRIYYATTPSQTHCVSAHAVVSLTTLPSAMRDLCTANHVAWFDIETRECSDIAATSYEEIRSFLARYGLRFKVV